MRTLLGVGLVLGLACGVAAAADVDAKKLVGKWELVSKKADVQVEYTGDGKVRGSFSFGTGDDKKEFKFEGTYKVEGDKLSVTVKGGKDGDKERTQTSTITKLTDTDLEVVGEGKDGKDETRAFKRVKP